MWRAVPGIAFLLIVAVLSFVTYDRATAVRGGELVGSPAPTIHVKKMDGFTTLPSETILFKHEVTLVNFFASWCTPCLAEHPYLNQLSHEYDVQLVGIGWRDSADNISSMLAEHGNPYDYVALDMLDATALNFGVEGLPESFLVGRDGKVIATHRGPLTPDVIRAKILPYLQ